MDAVLDAIPTLGLALLGLCGVVCALYWGVVLWRAVKTARELPTLEAGLELASGIEDWPSLAVIVPAHNEEAVIARVARSLLGADYPGLSITFALDRCTDRTREVLDGAIAEFGDDLSKRVEVVEIESCPDDWAGKTHAMHRALADGDLPRAADMLLYLDADTWLDPRALKAAVALHKERELDLLSLLCTLTSKRLFEVVAQPAVGFELVRQFPLDRVNGEPGVAPKRNFANGQFMLWTRTSFEALGGHESVKGELLEDMALARRLGSRAFRGTYRGGCLLAAGLVRCEMYRDWPAFIKGWKRIFTEAAHRKPRRLRKAAMLQAVTDAALVDVSLVGVFVGVITEEPILVGICGAGLATAIAAHVVICKQQGARLICALTFSEGALASAWILHTAARELRNGTQTQWGGRSYSRPVRGEHA